MCRLYINVDPVHSILVALLDVPGVRTVPSANIQPDQARGEHSPARERETDRNTDNRCSCRGKHCSAQCPKYEDFMMIPWMDCPFAHLLVFVCNPTISPQCSFVVC